MIRFSYGRPCLAGLLLAGSSVLASAQTWAPLSQDRFVQGRVEGSQGGNTMTDEDIVSAPDLLPFEESASILVNIPEYSANAGGWQSSQITPTGFTAQGTSFANSSTCAGWSVSSSGRSTASITFEVYSWVHFDLSGEFEGYDGGFASWDLIRDSGQYVANDFGILKGLVPTSAQGFLRPDIYTLTYYANSGGGSSSCGSGFGNCRYDIEFEITDLVEQYCEGAPNSNGPGARMGLLGSLEIFRNLFTVRVFGASSSQFGVFFYGADQVSLPFGDGLRCVGGTTYRIGAPAMLNANGFTSRDVDFTQPPAGSGAGQILPGSRWNFQFWYRDPLAGGSGFNLSDGMSVEFLP